MQNAPAEHSAVLLTCIKLTNGLKTFVLSIFEWSLKIVFTVRGSLHLLPTDSLLFYVYKVPNLYIGMYIMFVCISMC